MGITINFFIEKATHEGYVCIDDISWDLGNSDIIDYFDEFAGDDDDLTKSEEYSDAISGTNYGHGILTYIPDLKERIMKEIDYWVEENGKYGDFYDDANRLIKVLDKFIASKEKNIRLVWVLY